MGVDTNIRLPEDVRVRDVAEAIGILAGLKPRWADGDENKWVEVPGAKVEGYKDIPSCANIMLKGKMADGMDEHHVMFHYEPDAPHGGRLLSPRSTPFWIAVGLGLAKFFGGSVCFNDCDGKVNKRFKKPRRANNPSDGGPWHKFQHEMMAIKPLTAADPEAVRKFAAYK